MGVRHCTMIVFVVWGVGYAAGDEVDYSSQIKPILATKCYSCHGALRQQASLRLETRALMLVGGDSGPVITPGEANQSRLIERVTAEEDERMPPAEEGAPLTAEEINLLRRWIDCGAAAPNEPIPPNPRDHWAFQKPIRPHIPRALKTSYGVRWRHRRPENPIDAFLAAQRRRRGLVPLQRAEKHILLRRVYLDLLGLPPTRRQLQAFLNDRSSDAYQKVVRRLLAHPGYGQRFGRHWMDIWRYSDWYGLGAQVRYSQKHIWRWRDWIIQSLNEDKPYDRMIVEMLAGDEIAPTDRSILRATGFLARNYFLFNRTTWLDTTVEHTSKALLGLTLNCARCHDHKYDPLRQTDYYRMRAIFEPHQVRIDPAPGETNLDRDGLARAFDNEPQAPTYLFVRGNEKQPDKSRVIPPGVPAVLATDEFEPTPMALPFQAYAPGLQEFALGDHLAAAQQKILAARKAIAAVKRKLTAAQRKVEEKQPNLDAGGRDGLDAGGRDGLDAVRAELAIAEKTLAAALPHPAALRSAFAADIAKAKGAPVESVAQLARQAALSARKYELAGAELAVAQAERELAAAKGKNKDAAKKKLASARVKRDKAAAALKTPGDKYTSLYVSRRAANGMIDEATGRHGPYSKTSTGRRTALARWIASRENPLTARVAVNHIWMRHFGQPLVDSMTDFGLRTAKPRQQQLLDWLAVEFMENNWSMKRLHWLIVTSRAYKLGSSLLSADEQSKRADADNHYYWRRKPLRMESQVIRDSVLHLAGVLDDSLGGPTIDPAKEETVFRRSLYFTHSRDDRAKFISMFDDADILRCYRRKVSIAPQQALTLANSKFALSMSRKIAAKLSEELGPNRYASASDRQFIVAAFETVLLARPTPEELAACLKAIDDTRSVLLQHKHAKPNTRARENLVHALLNHNDFLTIR